MLHVDNDMEDEIFRRAAEGYPLKTDNPDWDSVVEKLDAEASNKESERTTGKKNKRGLLSLLLLLPMAFICNHYSAKYTSQKENREPVFVAKKSIELNRSNNNLQDKAITNPNPSIKANQNLVSQQKINVFHSSARKHFIRISEETELYSPSAGKQNNSKTNPLKKSVTSTSAQKKDQQLSSIKPIEETATANIEKKKTAIVPKATGSNDTLINQSTVQKKTIKKQDKNKQGIYIGIVAGPDISSIKFENVKRVGLQAGVLVGYHLKNNFSVETGLFYDKKFYSTTGENFKVSTYYRHFDEVNGVCFMYEIPVSVKYDFKTFKNSNFFASSGFTSYLMKSENYNYSYTDAWGQEAYGSWKNNDGSSFWISNINISAGYNYNITKSGSLRVEPYLKIPVKKIGMGNLPLMSSGVFIGYIKKF